MRKTSTDLRLQSTKAENQLITLNKYQKKKRPNTFCIPKDYLAANFSAFVSILLTRNSPTFFPFDAPLTIAGI